jgi:spore coat polysaccharide biosynthesis protein SpsF
MSRYTPKQYATALFESLQEKGVKADVVVRITSDCPLIDPVTIDAVVEKVEKGGNVDYASNILRRTYPRGLDTEAFTANVLERVNRDAKSFPAREHVTYFILQENPTMFRTQSVEDSQDNSDLRWTVDVLEDLKMVRQIYSDLNLDQTNKTYREIVAYVRANPQVSALNATVQQKKV